MPFYPLAPDPPINSCNIIRESTVVDRAKSTRIVTDTAASYARVVDRCGPNPNYHAPWVINGPRDTDYSAVVKGPVKLS